MPRTFGSIKESFTAYCAAGSNTKETKDFDNVIHQPLLDMDASTLLISFLPWNCISFWELSTTYSKILQICGLGQNNGGHFAGNDCHKLLQNIDILQRLAEESGAFQALGFVDSLRKFNDSVNSCFGTTLQEDFYDKLQSFK